jgi:iron complex transport system ATP-binding protein
MTMPHARDTGSADGAGLAMATRDLAVGYRVRRERRIVLHDLNLRVRPGELVCLLGPNGIGKSTLLRTIAKMQPVMAGSVEVGGSDLRDLSQMDLARRLGVVLTERLMAGALTGQRVVELGRYPHSGWMGSISAHDRAVVQWAIDAVCARHLAARDYNKLSDGERQRIMIARALAQEPLMLLLDEPTAFLDVPSRVELMGLLRLLARSQRLAVILSTHDLELALRTADTVWLVMPDGQLCAGAPEDVVLAGDIASAFEAATIRFRPEERTFRLVTGSRGRAIVHGSGLRAVLASAVLEREGYAVITDAHEPEHVGLLRVSVDRGPRGWHASLGSHHGEGDTFSALAGFVRDLSGPES